MDSENDVIHKYVENLPQEMRDYLAKDTWRNKLSLISQVYKINDDQASSLKAEVFLVLVSMENYSDLKTNIEKNIPSIPHDTVLKIVDDIESQIFAGIKPLLIEIEKAYNEAEQEERGILSKEDILGGIENPAPAKPTVTNPAGKNPVLDAQHNLPEGEKKVLISSAAVPSRGPMLGNFKTVSGMSPAQTTPAPQIIPPIQPKPTTPTPFVQPQISPRSPQVPIPPLPKAPDKYTTDPYREPAE